MAPVAKANGATGSASQPGGLAGHADAVWARWPAANPAAAASGGALRVALEDFEVTETLAFEPTGAGEHLYLFVAKRGLTTRAVQQALATAAGVAPMDVSYAGMKDKRAVARQWFSVRRPRKETVADAEGWTVLAAAWHERKLRRGELQANRFRIRIRDVSGPVATHLERVVRDGVPNYFGPQRFGADGGNVARAVAWLEAGRPALGHFARGLHLSSLRSFIFNEVLAARVADGTWRVPLPGDALFGGAASGPLWGRGRPPASGAAGNLEAAVAVRHEAITGALEHVGLRHERRPLGVAAAGLSWRSDGQRLIVEFSLPPGAYATSVLREAGRFTDAGGHGVEAAA